jgi:hypothetical protein
MAVYILWERTVTPQQTIANHGTTQTYLIRYTQCHNTIRQSGTTKEKFEIRIYMPLCNRVFVLLNKARLTASFQCSQHCKQSIMPTRHVHGQDNSKQQTPSELQPSKRSHEVGLMNSSKRDVRNFRLLKLRLQRLLSSGSWRPDTWCQLFSWTLGLHLQNRWQAKHVAPQWCCLCMKLHGVTVH